MVRDSQDREEPGTLHGALDVMSACEIQQTVSCDIESRQLSQSREGRSVGAVVADKGNQGSQTGECVMLRDSWKTSCLRMGSGIAKAKGEPHATGMLFEEGQQKHIVRCNT